MQNFIQNKWKQGVIFFIFSLQIMVISAMKVPMLSHDLSLKPEKTITLFDPKVALEFGTPWNKVVPGSMMITPDGKGIVIGECGRVRYVRFDAEEGEQSKILIEHPWVEHSPMIEMAQKKDGSLLIVSAGNYTTSFDKKRVAEYILFCNGSSKIKKIEWPIQAISLDSSGKILAIAGQREMVVIDLETEEDHRAFFRDIRNNTNWVVDIAVNPEGTGIIAVASNQGSLQWMMVSKSDKNNIDVSTLKQTKCKDIVKKIYYPNREELLYVTNDGKAKRIDMRDLIANDNEFISSMVFADSSSCNMGIGDPGEHTATAHWTSNSNTKTDIQPRIKVYRKGKECIEKFILEMPALEERYDYIAELGQCSSGIGHLLNAALRDTCVVALATDGKLRLWYLPEKNIVYNEADKMKQEVCEKLVELEVVSYPMKKKEKDVLRSSVGSIKKYSSSEKISKHKSSMSVDSELGDKSKKASPRFIHILKSSSAHTSRDASPPLSRDNSPARSPRKIETADVNDAIKALKNYEDKV